MGTNYFLVRNRPTTREPYHIGKSSCGWKFHFQEQHEPWNDPPIVWSNYQEVKDTLKRLTVDSTNFIIMDEYDEVIPFDEFIDLVEWKQENEDNPDDYTYCKNVGGYRFDDCEFW